MTSAIAAIHSGCKQLGIDEEGRRAIYARVTGKDRLTLMSPGEKEAVVGELRRLGFTSISKRPNGRARLSGKYAGKLQALWIAAHNLGIVDNRDDAALEAFIKRQTGIERERWLHHAEDADKVIEALKGWIAREGGVQWDVAGLPKKSVMRAMGFKTAVAQWAILMPRGAHLFWSHVNDILDQDELYRGYTDAEWITVMNYLGKRIRSEKKAGAK